MTKKRDPGGRFRRSPGCGGAGRGGARRALLAALLSSTALACAGRPAAAQSATWLASPATNNYSAALNWTGGSGPPAGTAFFDASDTTSLSVTASGGQVGAWMFNAGAPAYAFDILTSVSFFFTGAGIVQQPGSGGVTIANNGFLGFISASSAGSAAITNNTNMVFGNSSTAGSAAITNLGGTINFNNTSTAGNAFIDNNTGGTVNFNNTGTAGSAAIDNFSSGTVNFGNTSTAGSAGIDNLGGTVNFNDTSTAGSAAINNFSGTVNFNDTGTAGSAAIDNFSSGTVNFGNTSTAGSAGIDNLGGTVNFNDTSTAGSAAINHFSGTVNFNNTSTAGNASIINNFGSIVNFGNTSTAGSATITNNGALGFANASSAGSATIANTLNLSFNDTSTAGDASIDNLGGIVNFNSTATAGNATVTNGGFLEFFDNSTAGNATIVNDCVCGIVTFNDTSTAGSAAITNHNWLLFLDNSTAGNAAILNNAGATADFSSSLGPAGDRRLSAGSIAGAGAFVLGANELTVGGNGLSTEVSGEISGTGGSLVKAGAGTLTLSGVSTYTGPTAVNAGALLVNGAIASSLTTVNAGAVLGGTGTVRDVAVNGGVFAPGSGAPGSTMTVNGNLSFSPGGTYRVFLDPAAASAAVTGTATLTGGTVNAVFAPGAYVAKQYAILTAAGGLGGTAFAGLTSTNLPANFTSTLSYDASTVFLDLALAFRAPGGLNRNQQQVADALGRFFDTAGVIPAQFAVLSPEGLSQASGEVASGAPHGAFQLGGWFLGLMLDPFAGGRPGSAGNGGPALGFAPEPPAFDALALARAPAAALPRRWSVWGGAFGGRNHTSGSAAVGSQDRAVNAYGVAAGLDHWLTPATRVGFALSGGATGWSLEQGLGSGKSDAFQAGLHGTTHAGPFHLGAALGFGQHWMSTERNAPGSRLSAGFEARSYGARVEGGVRLDTAFAALIPYAALQAQRLHLPAYGERDPAAGGFGLAYASRRATHVRSELGARFEQHLALAQGAALALRGRLAWAHDRVSDPTAVAVFQTLPGAGFTVSGAAPASDLALVSAGAEWRFANGVALGAKFDGEFGRGSHTYAGTATLRASF